MKRFLPAAAVLFLMTTPLFAAAAPPRLVDDVIRMSKAGVEDETILEFVAKTEGHYVVTTDDIIAMTEAGVPKPVIKAVVKGSDWREGSREASTDEHSTTVYVEPPYYPYYGWNPFYDPWWYMPRLYVNYGFNRGGGHHGGGHDGGHHGGGGGHDGGHGGGGQHGGGAGGNHSGGHGHH
jgi:hypothetical protein